MGCDARHLRAPHEGQAPRRHRRVRGRRPRPTGQVAPGRRRPGRIRGATLRRGLGQADSGLRSPRRRFPEGPPGREQLPASFAGQAGRVHPGSPPRASARPRAGAPAKVRGWCLTGGPSEPPANAAPGSKGSGGPPDRRRTLLATGTATDRAAAMLLAPVAPLHLTDPPSEMFSRNPPFGGCPSRRRGRALAAAPCRRGRPWDRRASRAPQGRRSRCRFCRCPRRAPRGGPTGAAGVRPAGGAT